MLAVQCEPRRRPGNLPEADEILGVSLSRLCWEGPEEELTLTRNAQPALLVHSVAVLRVVGDRLGPVAMAAGHSLGEFTAHVAAGTLSFEDALGAVRLRGSSCSPPEAAGRDHGRHPGAG
jgi:[acyl-carrier-protein] S-malonyltransferase